MEAPDYSRLKKMFKDLHPFEYETALACWDEYTGWDWKEGPMGGVQYAAWAYWVMTELSQPEGKLNLPKKTPHEVEKELNAFAASARDLRAKADNMSKEGTKLLEYLYYESHGKNKIQLDENEIYLQHSNLLAWFPLLQRQPYQDGSLEIWMPNVSRSLELEALAQTFDELAKNAKAQKQPHNGLRKGANGRLLPVEQLFFIIGRMASFRKCDMKHVIPIAGKIHEWVKDQVPTPDWGIRPYNRIKEILKNPNWLEPDEERIPKPPLHCHIKDVAQEAMEKAKMASLWLNKDHTPPKG